MRKTWGWRKRWDRISLTQLCQCTGLSRPTVVKCVELLEHNNLIRAYKPNKRVVYYTIERSTDGGAAQKLSVKELNQVLPKVSKDFCLLMVKKFNHVKSGFSRPKKEPKPKQPQGKEAKEHEKLSVKKLYLQQTLDLKTLKQQGEDNAKTLEFDVGKLSDILDEAFPEKSWMIPQATIERLTEKYGAKTVNHKILLLDAQKDKIKNPGAWLTAACKEGYEPSI